MTDLTREMISEKLKKVDEDLSNLEREGGSLRKVEVLKEYKSYLEDELKNMNNDK